MYEHWPTYLHQPIRHCRSQGSKDDIAHTDLMSRGVFTNRNVGITIVYHCRTRSCAIELRKIARGVPPNCSPHCFTSDRSSISSFPRSNHAFEGHGGVVRTWNGRRHLLQASRICNPPISWHGRALDFCHGTITSLRMSSSACSKSELGNRFFWAMRAH